jgi:cell division transport system permease protein
LGIFGWLLLSFGKLGKVVKEGIQAHVWFNNGTPKKQIDTVYNYIKSQPYVDNIVFVDKAKALQIWNKENDSSWKQILDANPLHESIDFNINSDYKIQNSLDSLSNELISKYPLAVSEVQYPRNIVAKIDSFWKYLTIGIFILAIIISIIVIFSIDNTIRLSMYSNRFLIKTMQMVGATRGFIARPMNVRAIINGLIASLIAILFVWSAIFLSENYVPGMNLLHDNRSMLLLFLLMIILGVCISLFSTHRSVIKYLRMKLDDLY